LLLHKIEDPPLEGFDLEKSSDIEVWADPQNKIIILKSIDDVPGEGKVFHVSISHATRAQCANILLQLFPGRIWDTDWRKQPYQFWSKL